MKKKVRRQSGYCRVASAILGTTVLSVQEPVSTISNALNQQDCSPAVAVFADGSLYVVDPACFMPGKLTVADLQSSILYTTGDAVFSEQVITKLG